MSELWPWLSAFALTQAVEVPIYVRALRQGPQPSIERLSLALALGFAASAITHPIVWFVWPVLLPGDWLTMAIVAELFAITTEAAWLRAFGLPRALAWAGLANAASVLIGLGSRALFAWP